MTLTIATDFDRDKRDEVFTTFGLTDSLVQELLVELFQKMDYEQRSAWLQKHASQIVVISGPCVE